MINMEREESIQMWGTDRGIIQGATAMSQLVKLREEYVEMLTDKDMDSIGDQFVVLSMIAGIQGSTAASCYNAIKDTILPKEDSLKRSVGQCLNSLEFSVEIRDKVTCLEDIGFYVDALIRQAEEWGYSFDKCIETAWRDIRHRTGALVHGIFVKQANLDKLNQLFIDPHETSMGFTLKGLVPTEIYEKSLDELDKLGYTYSAVGYEDGVVTIETTGTTKGA